MGRNQAIGPRIAIVETGHCEPGKDDGKARNTGDRNDDGGESVEHQLAFERPTDIIGRSAILRQQCQRKGNGSSPVSDIARSGS